MVGSFPSVVYTLMNHCRVFTILQRVQRFFIPLSLFFPEDEILHGELLELVDEPPGIKTTVIQDRFYREMIKKKRGDLIHHVFDVASYRDQHPIKHVVYQTSTSDRHGELLVAGC